MDKELQEAFLDLACQLSPENISCDGEASQRHIQQTRKRIMQEWAALEKKVGRKVTENEVWDREMEETTESSGT